MNYAIKPTRLLILAGTLMTVLLVLVLPQVDLPATAFHQGTAPAAVHARGTAAVSPFPVSTSVRLFFVNHQRGQQDHASPLLYVTASALPILHRSLRC